VNSLRFVKAAVRLRPGDRCERAAATSRVVQQDCFPVEMNTGSFARAWAFGSYSSRATGALLTGASAPINCKERARAAARGGAPRVQDLLNTYRPREGSASGGSVGSASVGWKALQKQRCDDLIPHSRVPMPRWSDPIGAGS